MLAVNWGPLAPVSDKPLRGKNATFVKLISADGYEFVLKKDYTTISSTIKDMLSGPVLENWLAFMIGHSDGSMIVGDSTVGSHTLIRVVQYMQYKVRYTNSSTEIPEFKIEPEIAIGLLMAANFLNC